VRFCDQFDSPFHAGSLRHPRTLHALMNPPLFSVELSSYL
jgi:hypothetical protein